MRFVEFLTENDFEDPAPDEHFNVEKANQSSRALEHEIDMIDSTIEKLKQEGKVQTFIFISDIPKALEDPTKFRKLTRKFPTSDGMCGVASKRDWEWIAIFIPKNDVQTQRYVKALLDKKVNASQALVDIY